MALANIFGLAKTFFAKCADKSTTAEAITSGVDQHSAPPNVITDHGFQFVEISYVKRAKGQFVDVILDTNFVRSRVLNEEITIQILMEKLIPKVVILANTGDGKRKCYRVIDVDALNADLENDSKPIM